MHVNCLNSVRIEGTNKSDTKSDHAALLTDVKMKVFKLGLNAGQKRQYGIIKVKSIYSLKWFSTNLCIWELKVIY